MALIDSIILSLVARNTNYNRKMRQSRRATRQLTGSIRALKTAAATLGAGISLAGLTALASSQLRAADNLGKTADKLGITTEALSGLRLAARRTGVETRTFDLGLQRMVRRIAEAAAGTGEAKKALVELGLDAKRLNALDPAAQFRALAQAMQPISNQADRVRLSMKLFDSEGVALVNTLAVGSEGLARFEQRARELGLTLSRDQIKNVEAASDAWDDLKDRIAGAVRQMVAANSTSLKGLADQARGVADAFTVEPGKQVRTLDGRVKRFKDPGAATQNIRDAVDQLLNDPQRRGRPEAGRPGSFRIRSRADRNFEREIQQFEEQDRLHRRMQRVRDNILNTAVGTGTGALRRGIESRGFDSSDESLRRLPPRPNADNVIERKLDEVIAAIRESGGLN